MERLRYNVTTDGGELEIRSCDGGFRALLTSSSGSVYVASGEERAFERAPATLREWARRELGDWVHFARRNGTM
jgi:hypothetical protein